MEDGRLKKKKEKTFRGKVEGSILIKFITVVGEVGSCCVLLRLINTRERRRPGLYVHVQNGSEQTPCRPASGASSSDLPGWQ